MALTPLKARTGIAAQIAAGVHVHKFRFIPLSSVEATMSRRALGIAAALITMPFMGLPAWADTCVMAPVGTYTAPGFSCSEGGLTFSDFVVNATALPIEARINFRTFANPTDISPFFNEDANALGVQLDTNQLVSAVSALQDSPASSDIRWSYNVSSSGLPLNAIFVQAGSSDLSSDRLPSGTASILLSVDLGNVGQLSLPGLGTATVAFAPKEALHVVNDSLLLSGEDGFAVVPSILNAFGIVRQAPVHVPGPIAGAGLPGLILACGALLALARRRRQLVV
jgi:hypothetical protein